MDVEVLVLILGEYGDILTFAFAESKGPKNWQVLHDILRKRCEKRGQYFLNQVSAGYDELGSGNLKNPRDHWFAKYGPR